MNGYLAQILDAEVAEFIMLSDVTSGTIARHATDPGSLEEVSSYIMTIPKEGRNILVMDESDLRSLGIMNMYSRIHFKGENHAVIQNSAHTPGGRGWSMVVRSPSH